MIVAIDGPAGSGKSSVAECVAESLGFHYLNSGRLYRAVTYWVLRNVRDPSDSASIVARLSECDIRIEGTTVYLGDRRVDEQLHTDEVDAWVATHSAIREVRSMVNTMLHRFAREHNSVVEGRDITTVVFPNAEVKVYL
ncbi:MAG: (d)CMP kinase, partial [Spirochaetales bacterium]